MGDKVVRNRNRSRDGPFKCKTCDREFPSAQALGGHRSGYSKNLLQRHGPTDINYSCSECGHKCLSRSSLTRHRRLHRAAGKKPITATESGDQMQIRDDDDDDDDDDKKTVNLANPDDNVSPVANDVKMAGISIQNNPRLMNIDLNLTPFRNFVENGVLFS